MVHIKKSYRALSYLIRLNSVIKGRHIKMRSMRKTLSYLILGQKGGHNRIEMIKLLNDRPYNLNQLAEIMNLNYRTIKHHMDILLKNEVVSSSKTGGYGEVYFLTPDMEGNMHEFDDVIKKFEKSKKLSDFTSSPKFFQRVMEQTNDAVIIINKEGQIFFLNSSAEELCGIKEDETMGDTVCLFPNNEMQDDMIKRASVEGHVVGHEVHLKHTSGKLIDVDLTMDAIKDDKDNVIGFSILTRDISDRKDAENQKQLTIEILERLNKAGKGRDIIRDILSSIKEYTGFEAVAIRLKETSDYPYFENRGFPGDFIEAENSICPRVPEEESKDTPILECVCGNVISGRIDSSLPYFTRGGSFWANSTKEQQDYTENANHGGHFRNRCANDGYQSVALVPLRSEEEIIGLLQFNDKNPNKITEDMIHFFEKLGSSIGIAFKRMNEENSK
jgi:PAS domain S-box-containing protein